MKNPRLSGALGEFEVELNPNDTGGGASSGWVPDIGSFDIDWNQLNCVSIFLCLGVGSNGERVSKKYEMANHSLFMK